jgi:hypothetical protein
MLDILFFFTFFGLPARLSYARKLTLEGEAAEAKTTHVKFSHERTGTAAERATILGPGAEFRLNPDFDEFTLFRQALVSL